MTHGDYPDSCLVPVTVLVVSGCTRKGCILVFTCVINFVRFSRVCYIQKLSINKLPQSQSLAVIKFTLLAISVSRVNISSVLFWRPCFIELAETAAKKLLVLFMCCEHFSSEQLLQLYRGLVSGSSAVSLLNKVESKAYHLMHNPAATSTIGSLVLCGKVASLSFFFYIDMSLFIWACRLFALTFFHGHAIHGSNIITQILGRLS